MGLGLFIAKTLLERSGGEVSFANSARSAKKTSKRRGAIAEVVWSRDAIISNASGETRALGENQPFPI